MQIIYMIISIVILVFVYSGYIFVNIWRTGQKRKKIKAGDVCQVYIGETKINAYVLKVNSIIDVWVLNKVMKFPRKQIYA
ncbi:MAG: hypothetical protein B6D61_08330 [Bacteroidetes bacterium 4484_249]|nr:MAG: hypothetical protein B6D61_08330 [Bacteroidetes bacterium 4484_249]